MSRPFLMFTGVASVSGLWATRAIAHPGHGWLPTTQPWHNLLDPLHGAAWWLVGTAAALLSGWVCWRRSRRGRLTVPR